MTNPFLNIDNPNAWGPGSFEMALPLVTAVGIKQGMRVLEVGAGSGQIAATLAKHWSVSVVTLEPWTDGSEIHANTKALGVENQVLPLRLQAQSLPFPNESFDAVISIGAFEMIGDDRPQVLSEIVRVLKVGCRFGIAEPMCLPVPMPNDVAKLDTHGFQQCFRSVPWNVDLFREHSLKITCSEYFPEASQWWLNYSHGTERDLIIHDAGRWVSLGMVVGEK